MYVVFTRQKDHLYLHVDNVGPGKEEHPKEKDQKPECYFPYSLTCIEFKSIVPPSGFKPPATLLTDSKVCQRGDTAPIGAYTQLFKYIEHLLIVNFAEGQANAYYQMIIYDKLGACFSSQDHKLSDSFRSQVEQAGDYCTYCNLQIGLDIRYKTSPFLKNLQAAELVFANPETQRVQLDDKQCPLMIAMRKTSPRLPEYLIDFMRDSKNVSRQPDEKVKPLSEIYTEVSIGERRKELSQSAPSLTRLSVLLPDSKVRPLTEWFRRKETVSSRRIFLEGETGIGKSTLCQHIALEVTAAKLWSGQFEIALVIPLRLLPTAVASGKNTMLKALSETNLCFPRPLQAMETRLFSKLLEERRVLLLLDGADEMPEERSSNLETVYQELLNYPYSVMTRRPYRLPPLQMLQKFDYLWKITGFNSTQACGYVEKFFKMPSLEQKKAPKDKETKEKKGLCRKKLRVDVYLPKMSQSQGVTEMNIRFKWKHFQKEMILMAVRWYVAYSLSYRDIEELIAERGSSVDHATINRWVVQYAPLLEESFRQRHKKSVGSSWRMDETYIKIKGDWHYLYRAVDKEGQTIDCMLSKTRAQKAAEKFLEKAIGSGGLPDKVTIDKSGANKAGLEVMNFQLEILLGWVGQFFEIRQLKYLNNLVEQDHRAVKRIVNPMMGFKAFHSAEATLAGIELYHMLRKRQHREAANAVFEQFYALAA